MMPVLSCSFAGATSGATAGHAGTPSVSGLHYLNDLTEAPLTGGPAGISPLVGAGPGTLVDTAIENLTPMHSSLNNNNNMVSAGPSPSSSISPLHNATHWCVLTCFCDIIDQMNFKSYFRLQMVFISCNF